MSPPQVCIVHSCWRKRPRNLGAAKALAAGLGALLIGASFGAASQQPTVIELTQIPCQFLESEGNVDRGYRSRNIADCEAINAKTGAARLTEAKPMRLKAGQYIFRVTNRNVPYELGFWVRGASLAGRVRLPSVSGGGLMTGKTQDYAIKLAPGEYVYSCPLNPTPDYKLSVY